MGRSLRVSVVDLNTKGNARAVRSKLTVSLALIGALSIVLLSGGSLAILALVVKPVDAANVLSAIVAITVTAVTALAGLRRWYKRRSRALASISYGARSDSSWRSPHQLPPGISHHIGRTSELEQLNNLISARDRNREAIFVVTAVSGLGGIGKTSLVLHWAHRSHRSFPDGQLYIDLRGFDPLAQPMNSTEALETLLRSIGVPGDRVPESLDERAALFRTLVDGRRILIVLDNARSVEQVRPLLPGAPSCICVVTSRDSLVGLAINHGARAITLGPFSRVESDQLISSVLSADADGERFSKTELAHIHKLCSGLPLAVRIVAEKIARGSLKFDANVNQEGELLKRLDAVEIPSDPRASIRGVASWSYKSLHPDAARLFRRFGLSPGEDITTFPIAAMSGFSSPECLRLLSLLREASLVVERSSGRWWMHDLLTEYAAERAELEDGPEVVKRSVQSLCSWYLAASSAAVDAMAPFRERIPAVLPETDVPLPRFTGPVDAKDWLETERKNIVEVIRLADRRRVCPISWQLLHTVWRFFYLADYVSLGDDLLRQVLETVRVEGDVYGEAALLNCYGLGLQRLARYNEALVVHERAERLAHDSGYTYGRERALLDLGNIKHRLGENELAGEHYGRALQSAEVSKNRTNEIAALANLGLIGARTEFGRSEAVDYLRRSIDGFREIGNTYGVATSISNLAIIYRRHGRFDESVAGLCEALQLVKDLGSKGGECEMLNQLGLTHTAQRDFKKSLSCHTEALEIATVTGDRYEEGVARDGIGHALAGLGRLEDALGSWVRAKAIFTELRVPEAADVDRAITSISSEG